MKFINQCIICNSEDKETIEKQEFQDSYLNLVFESTSDIKREIVVCKNCGFVYHNPQLEEDELVILYKKFRDTVFREETADMYFERITSIPDDHSENYVKVNNIKEYINYEGNNHVNSILDIGCGAGVFLNSFHQEFPYFKLFGVEPTSAYANIAKAKLNAEIRNDNYMPGLFGNKFDIITINHVLEHVSDPILFMKEVLKDLKEGGIVYLEVPDVSDLKYLQPDHDRFMMQHLWIFSRNSLRNVCNKSGFTIENIRVEESIRGKQNIVAILRKSSKYSHYTSIVKDDYNNILELRHAYYKYYCK